MTREDDFIGQLEGYLDDYEGLTPLPDATRDAIRARLPKTRQIGSLPGPMRYLSMSMSIPAPARYGLAAAVVVAAAVLGGALFAGGRNNPAEPGPTASPTQTPTSTPEPTPELLEPGAIEPATDVEVSFRVLRAGTYHVDMPPMRITFTVPAGWGEWAYTSEKSQLDLTGPTSGFISFGIVENVSAGSCPDELLDPPVGPSVDDLVTALSALKGFDVSPVTDVTIDGFRGKQFTLTAPPSSACDLRTWATSTRVEGVGLGEVNHVRILDVDGGRLLISIGDADDPADLRKLEEVLDSVQITP